MSDLQGLLSELETKLRSLEVSLPKQIDPRNISKRARTPWKAVIFREALAWRSAELASAAHGQIKCGAPAAAVILVRAHVETSAAAWYLLELIRKQNSDGFDPDVDDTIVRLVMGSRSEPLLPGAINVLTFVDKVERDIPGFRRSYDKLSEIAHPNWAGTSLLYLEHDRETFVSACGSNDNSGTFNVAALTLLSSVSIFEFSYNNIAAELPAFIAGAEAALPPP